MDKADLAEGRVQRAAFDFAHPTAGAANQRSYWSALESTFTTLGVAAGEGFLKECFPASAYKPVGYSCAFVKVRTWRGA